MFEIDSYINPLTKSSLEKLKSMVLEMNQKMNIISKGDEETIWERHILDSLQALRVIDTSKNSTVLDMGSGYGFPVLPLAIVLSNCHFTAVESRSKRVSVINYLRRELSLKNITVSNERVEDLKTTELFDYVTSRALGSITEDVNRAKLFLKKGATYIGYKTEKSEESTFLDMTTKNFEYEQARNNKNYYIVSVTKN